MRRDYFTCVFLASIAGALLFVCFEPLYLKYGGVVYREFGLVESISSVFYAVAFLIAIPLFAGYKRKYWIAVGLACYGVLAYLPSIFYPKQVLITGESASIFHVIIAMILRGIYGMVNAPFAPLSRLWGDEVAASMSKWILPMAVLIPLIIVELILLIVTIRHILTHDHYKRGTRALWLVIAIVGMEFIGPILYFILGKADDE